MKRLYVRPAFRSFGMGRLLVERLMDEARLAGYTPMLLDTLSGIEAACALYQDADFVGVAPCYFNPNSGACFLEAAL
jgi:GNAT superfamily N-acetyltransferase